MKKKFPTLTTVLLTVLVKILSVNGFIEWSTNIFGSFRAYFVLSFFSFYCWLAFAFSENLCVTEEL